MSMPAAASAQVRAQLVTALELDLIGPTQRLLKALGAGALSTPGRRRGWSVRNCWPLGGHPIELRQGKEKPATAPPHAAAG